MLVGELKYPVLNQTVFSQSVQAIRWRYILALYIGDLSTKNLENLLIFELQGSVTTHFEGFVELSSLPLYLERFGGYNIPVTYSAKSSV